MALPLSLTSGLSPRVGRRLAWADHYWIEGVGHNEMLYSPSLIRCEHCSHALDTLIVSTEALGNCLESVYWEPRVPMEHPV